MHLQKRQVWVSSTPYFVQDPLTSDISRLLCEQSSTLKHLSPSFSLNMQHYDDVLHEWLAEKMQNILVIEYIHWARGGVSYGRSAEYLIFTTIPAVSEFLCYVPTRKLFLFDYRHRVIVSDLLAAPPHLPAQTLHLLQFHDGEKKINNPQSSGHC